MEGVRTCSVGVESGNTRLAEARRTETLRSVKLDESFTAYRMSYGGTGEEVAHELLSVGGGPMRSRKRIAPGIMPVNFPEESVRPTWVRSTPPHRSQG